MFNDGSRCSEKGEQTYDDKHKRLPSTTLDETVRYVHTLRKDDYCITITDMR